MLIIKEVSGRHRRLRGKRAVGGGHPKARQVLYSRMGRAVACGLCAVKENISLL